MSGIRPGRAGALVLIGAGGLATWRAWGYGLGEAARIGPGLLPLVAAVVLMACGVAVLLQSRNTPSTPGPAFRRLVTVFTSVFGSLLAFALLVRTAGFAPAAFSAFVLASLVEGRPRPATLVVAAVAAVVGALLFVYGLRIRVPVLAW